MKTWIKSGAISLRCYGWKLASILSVTNELQDDEGRVESMILNSVAS